MTSTLTTADPTLVGALATNVFGIGTYQSITGGTIFAQGTPPSNMVNANVHPFAGIYGGQYGFVLDTTIRPPQTVQWTPAGEIGRDTISNPVVRGYPQMSWSWGTVRPDYWYYYYALYKQSRRTSPGFESLVLLLYPDGLNNTPQLILARMDPPTHSLRDVGSYQQVTLHFSYLGEAELVPGQLVSVIS